MVRFESEFWCRIHLWFRWMGGLHAKSMTSQRYGATYKMADMRYYGNVMTITRWRLYVVLHLQQYSRKLNCYYFFSLPWVHHTCVFAVLNWTSKHNFFLNCALSLYFCRDSPLKAAIYLNYGTFQQSVLMLLVKSTTIITHRLAELECQAVPSRQNGGQKNGHLNKEWKH